MAIKKFNTNIDLLGEGEIQGALFENKEASVMEVEANQKKGRFYYDTVSNTFKYYNGSKWVAGAEGALTPIGTLDYSITTETAKKKKTVPTGLTGALCSKGDTWFVAKAGKYSFVDADGTSQTLLMHPADFLFCVEADPKGLVNAKWSYVSGGESLAIFEFKYDSAQADKTSWEFTNTLMTNNVWYHIYKEASVSSDTITTTTRVEEIGDVSFIKVEDSSDNSETYTIKVDFNHSLKSDEIYQLVVGTV